jgi:hypothetical protein
MRAVYPSEDIQDHRKDDTDCYNHAQEPEDAVFPEPTAESSNRNSNE